MGRLTGGGGSSVRERERRAGWRARGSRPEMGRGEGVAGARGGGGGERSRHGLDSAPQRGGPFPFSFYFLIPLSIFISFSFEQLIDNLRC
jgi:hypothetical protein